MILQKWNFATHQYELFDSPAVNVKLIAMDLDEHVDCANCGKDMEYGDGYTSRTIHNNAGLGFPVCEDCYTVERENEHEQSSKASN